MFHDQSTTDDWKKEWLAHINNRLKNVCMMLVIFYLLVVWQFLTTFSTLLFYMYVTIVRSVKIAEQVSFFVSVSRIGDHFFSQMLRQ